MKRPSVTATDSFHGYNGVVLLCDGTTHIAVRTVTSYCRRLINELVTSVQSNDISYNYTYPLAKTLEIPVGEFKVVVEMT
jgi:hypothetical protein